MKLSAVKICVRNTCTCIYGMLLLAYLFQNLDDLSSHASWNVHASGRATKRKKGCTPETMQEQLLLLFLVRLIFSCRCPLPSASPSLSTSILGSNLKRILFNIELKRIVLLTIH